MGSTNSSFTRVQQMQYYPSGLPWNDNYQASQQPYKYGGKEFVEMHGLEPTSNEDGEMKDDEEDGTDEDDEDFENNEDYENDKRVNIQKQTNEEKSYLIHLGLTKDYYHRISIAIHVYLEKNTLGLIKITKKKEPSTQIIDANLEINNDLIKIEDSETTPYCTLKRNIGIIEIIDNDGNKCLLKEHKKNSK